MNLSTLRSAASPGCPEKTAATSVPARNRGVVAAGLGVLLAVGLGVGLAGCRRSGPAGEAPAGGAAASAQEETARLLSELTQQVRKYSVEQRQPPRSLEELVARGYLKELPVAPAGQRFVITKNLQVELTRR